MKTVLIAVQGVQASLIERSFPAGEIEWIPFVADTDTLFNLEEALPNRFRRVAFARELDAVAKECRAPFSEWIDSLSARHGDLDDWWMGSIAGRSPFSSNLFLYFCWCRWLQNRCRGGKAPGMILVESAALAHIVRQLLSDLGFQGKVIGEGRWQDRPLYFLLKAGYHLAKYALALGSRFAAARRTRKRRRQPSPLVSLLLIDLFFFDKSFASDGTFTDKHYYPGLYGHLRRRKIPYALFPTFSGVADYRGFYNKMAQASETVVVAEDYLSLSDCLRVLKHPFRMASMQLQAAPLEGIDMAPALHEAHWRYIASHMAMEGLLKVRALAGMRRAGLRFHTVLDWNENHPFDRGLALGVRREYPGVPLIGAHLYISYFNLIHLYPTKGEYTAGVTPDIIVVSGKGLVSRLRSFYPQLPLRYGPALRYSALAGGGNITVCGKTVVVALPIGAGEAKAIITMLAKSMEEGLNVQLRIKLHPGSDRGKIMPVIQRFGQTALLAEEAMDELLSSAVVLVTGGSGACMEAVARGIPVVIVSPESVPVNNPMEGLDDRIWRLAFSAGEMREAVDHFAALEGAAKAELHLVGEALRKEFFEPVSEQVIDILLAPTVVNEIPWAQ